jgi:O-acetyl-ADP-ribose deacetylase (regulator of RNase III)
MTIMEKSRLKVRWVKAQRFAFFSRYNGSPRIHSSEETTLHFFPIPSLRSFMKIHVGNGEITVVLGDIADQETDAIVNAANTHLWMGAGVAGAIKRKGGVVIEQEAIAKGPIPAGTAVMTSAGGLKARRVIHAAVMGQDLRTNAELIEKATRGTLWLAEDEGLRSVSLPALGTGVGGFSVFHCASVMVRVAIEFMIKAASLREVRFVLYETATKDIFEDEVKNRFTAHPH